MAEFRISAAEALSNARLKIYPSKQVLQVSNDFIFHAQGYESDTPRGYDVPSKGNGSDPARSLSVSRQRAASKVRDIALCNRFTHFLTWTLDPKLIDRYDSAEVSRRLQTFLRNTSQRKGFTYVCVPERHKDGAIHIHGLCTLGDVRIEPAVNPHTDIPLSTKRGQQVYNMLDWKLGYSTCIPIDDNYEKAVNYVVKYLSKADEKIFGKWYYSTRKLSKTPLIALIDGLDYYDFRENNPSIYEVSLYGDVVLCGMDITEGVRLCG